MHLISRYACILTVLAISLVARSASAQQLAFEAKDLDGQTVELQSGSPCAVVFLGCECPMARSYAQVLNDLQADFRDQGLRVVGVMSNIQDSRQDVANYRQELNVEFPLVVDSTGAIADQYGARRTPEAYLLDAELKLRYHGRIDDQYAPGVARDKPNRQDLRLAISQLLSGKVIQVKNTDALGCIIGRKRTANLPTIDDERTTVTFTRQISRVLRRNCTECHRDGDIGPFSMQSYEDVAGWADTMLETIEDGRMPPWHATTDHREFSNARVMPASDKDLFREWIAQGTPEGDPSDLPDPIPSAQSSYVSLQRVDAEFPMRDRPFLVPSSGVVEYQYFVVDPKFEEDKWVRAAEVIPGRRDVVHHGIVFVRPPDGGSFRGVGWLTAYVPGQRLQALPDGYARKIPAGSKLIFQMHYTPSGTERADISKLGIQFVDPDSVTHEVYTLAALDQEFEIPPREAEFTVSAEVPRLPSGSLLLAATPHMHFRGKVFTASAKIGEGEETLLDVPRYDFNWQHTYHFADYIDLDSVKSLKFDATFDNSTNNPFNPDPEQWVSWGDQTFEEMALAFFEVAVPLDNERARSTTSQNTDSAAREQRESKVVAYVDRVFQQLDANSDGVIFESEAPIVVRWRGFSRFDLNSDGKATRDEVRRVAERVVR